MPSIASNETRAIREEAETVDYPRKSQSLCREMGGLVSEVYCKIYHKAPRGDSSGGLRERHDRKSTCPGWLSDPDARQKLLDDALDDPGGALDRFGRPKRKWNAVGGWVFVGVSTNEEADRYNCYPETPCTQLAEALEVRARRTLDEIISKIQ